MSISLDIDQVHLDNQRIPAEQQPSSEYRLHLKETNDVVARVLLWDMATFGSFWAEPLVGLLDIEVAEEQRRQNLGRFLLSFVLRELKGLQDTNFAGLEAVVPEENTAAIGLLNALGFVQVDTGQCWQREE